jgi:conjugative transfer region protein TrbK
MAVAVTATATNTTAPSRASILPSMTGRSTEAQADPLRDELIRCQSLGEAGPRDPGCLLISMAVAVTATATNTTAPSRASILPSMTMSSVAVWEQQLADLTAVVAANGRAQSLSEAERAAAAEQGREQQCPQLPFGNMRALPGW